MKSFLALFLFATILFYFSSNVAGQNVDPQFQFQINLQTERLQSGSAEIRRDAVQQLRLLENADASRAAANALKDSAEIVRTVAAEAVSFLADDEAAQFLAPVLEKDKSELVRREAAFALGEAHSKTAVPALIQALETDKQPSVRAAAAIALGKIADERAINSLSQILLAPDTKKNRRVIDEFVRRSAARSLGQIRFSSAAPALISALRNKNNSDDVRREAAFALGLIADQSAIAALQENLGSDDYLLAEIAADALKRIQNSVAANQN